MKLAEAIELFIQYQGMTDRSPSTVAGYRNDLRYFMSYLVENYNCTPYLDDVTSEDISEYLYYLKEELDYKDASRKRKLASLRSFYKYCHRKQFCSYNVAADIEPVKLKQTEKMYLSEIEVQTIVDVVEHPLIKLAIQTLYYTGLRISECINLTLADVHFEKNYIHVINGKGGKDRIIPMSQKLKKLLLDYKENWRPEVTSSSFFCTAKTGGLSRMYVNKVLCKALDKLGWSQEITAHTFRHSFASNLVKNEVNIVKIQKLLGHTSLVTTSVYTHTKLSELEEAVNSL
jgi:integrase/recombinase XerD